MAASFVALAARGSRLALSLYEAAAISESVAASLDFEQAAKGVGSFVRVSQQLVTSLEGDGSILSHAALDTLQSIASQADQIFISLQALHSQPTNCEDDRERAGALSSQARLNYLLGHLDSLRLTLLAMLQVCRTVTVTRPFKQQDVYLSQIDQEFVEDEMAILENITIEQQISLIQASNLYHESRPDKSSSGRAEAFPSSNHSEKTLISDDTRNILASKVPRRPPSRESNPHDASQPIASDEFSPHLIENTSKAIGINPALLRPFYASSLTHLINVEHNLKRLSGVLRAVPSHTLTLVRHWTCFGEDGRFELAVAKLAAGERFRSWSKHATVETAPESENDSHDQADMQDEDFNLPAPVPRRMPSSQSILSQTLFKTHAAHNQPETPSTMLQQHSTGPPANHPSTTFEVSDKPTNYFSHSPRPSMQSIPPIRAAAAAIDKGPENGDDLEIPWRLCLHNSYWDFIDASFVGTNTHLHPSEAYRDRRGFTEMSASWVCRQAIEEAEYDCLQVQKSVVSGRTSKLETAFIIHRPLQFGEVEKLVERTIEIVQEKADVSSHHDRSFRLQPQSQKRGQLLSPAHPTLDRSRSSPAAPILQPLGSFYADYQSQVASYIPHTTTRHRPPSRRSSTHSHTSHRSSYSHQGTSSPTLTFSDSDTDSHEERKERRRTRKDKVPKTKGSNKRAMGTLAKIGGAVALLEGLEHAF